MAATILIVEDEEQIARFLELELMHEGYTTCKADNGRSGLETAQSGECDLVLLDVMLPELNGLEVLRRLRRTSNLPVIMLTARDAVMDKVSGLDAGADDYITKPFGMMELVSRVKAVLRRSRRDDKKDEIIVGDLKIYPNKHKVKSCGNEVTLTNKEFKLLCLLVESKGNVLNRDQLLTNIWGYDFDGETRTVDVHIRSLRQKLGECGKLIETVRGIGYRIGGNES